MSLRATRLRMLPIPPPYRAWLTVANDPDFTTPKAWEELHAVIWEELQLPFADTFFVTNYNESFPDQVNLKDRPDILDAHPHDTMHTWGDFLQSRSHRFTRSDAVDALAVLQRLGVTPRVWSDHSNFTGNLIHRARTKAQPEFLDPSGYRFENFEYTADLIRQAGVRFIWDGELTHHVGQDRPLDRQEWYAFHSSNRLKAMLWSCADVAGQRVWQRLKAGVFDYSENGNRQYFKTRLADGQTFYAFRRFGTWRDADIDGLATLLSEPTLDRLMKVGGTCVIYTHLGKRNHRRPASDPHIPGPTRAALEDLATRYRNGDIMVSGTAKLLEYLTLRDHAIVGDRIDFQPDGVCFETLSPIDLAAHTFGVAAPTENFTVCCDGQPVACTKKKTTAGIYHVSFTATVEPPGASVSGQTGFRPR